ncbi:MAG: amidophosphoribosyltransferase [Candidatus Obscuribacterales bacterium]|nr:amidophosphoribosyltransferase [Candidatus Obscuribacterales bacterium]
MCGIIAISGTVGSAYEVFFGLMNLQHRGQDGAGILTVDGKDPPGFHLQKGSGLIDNVFSERSFKSLKGKAALGHSRYATVGRNDPNLLQPFLDSESGIGIGHNGNIVNYYALREAWLSSDDSRNKQIASDSQLILRLLSDHLKGVKEITDETLFPALGKLMDELIGSYSVVGLTKYGDLFGFRDPHGIRPLAMGTKETEDGEKVYALASESVALRFLEFNNIEELDAGEAVFISHEGKVTRKIIKKESSSPCMFEWVYFARVESEFAGQSVYKARFRLGLLLAEQLKRAGLEADVVVPVPETSRASAIAISEAMGIPFRELLIKNRYVNRTFILDDQQTRQEAIRRKLFPIIDEFEGQRCLIVDDSIVRGNTAKQLVRLVRQSGAKEITLVSTCPPINNPCYYGIDFPSADELIAYKRTEEEIAQELGADRVVFQTIEGLKTALEQKSLCTGCLTGEYPTSVADGGAFEEQRLLDRRDKVKEPSC